MRARLKDGGTLFTAIRPGHIALAYLVVGVLWILLSDRLVDWLLDDPSDLTNAQTLKGWFFVGGTALLLYFVLRRQSAGLDRGFLRQLRREAVLEAVGFAAPKFLRGGVDAARTKEAIGLLGVAAEVDRVYIYQNSPDGARCVLRNEWLAEGVEPLPREEGVKSFSWKGGSRERWAEFLAKREAFAARSSELPPVERAMLERQGAGAIAVVPIFCGEEWWGFLGFDVRDARRDWPQAEVSALVTAAELLGSAIERQQAEAEGELRSLAVEQAGESIMITDASGILRYVNPAFGSITGYSREEAVGKSIRILESGEHDPSHLAEFWATIQSGAMWSGRFINRRKDGSTYQQDTSVAPVKSREGKITGFVGVGRDVTQEAALESQLRHAKKMESLGLLASGIAHDFNNVMGLVLGAAERLRSVVKGDEVRYVEMILEAVKRGQSVSRRMLSFYREREAREEAFDILSLVDELVQVGKHTFPKNIEIRVEQKVSAGVVKADRSQIYQALMNLCVNAVSAMPDGGRLTLDCRPASAEEAARKLTRPVGSYYCVGVTDTGTGMESAIVEKIFDPYFTTKGTGQGTGLGLSIVFGTVKAQGGWVDVTSAVGSGSTFSIGIPASKESIEQAPEEDLEPPSSGEGELILVVDDEPVLRELLREVLEAEGYRVLEAEDGYSGLEAYRIHREDVDLVLTDLGMPRMGGPALIRELRSIDPRLQIIVTSGYMDPRQLDRIRAMGVADIVTKPFKMGEVRRVIQKVLSARQ